MNEDKDILVSAYGGLGQVRVALQRGNYAVFQGALTGIYNMLGGFIQSSKALSADRRAKLTAFNQSIFDLRNAIVTQIEINRKDFKTAVEMANADERLKLCEEALEAKIDEWYKP